MTKDETKTQTGTRDGGIQVVGEAREERSLGLGVRHALAGRLRMAPVASEPDDTHGNKKSKCK